MLGFKRLVAAATGFAMIGLTMALFNSAPVHATPPATTQNVNVVNTPLRVEGTVDVRNFPATTTVNGEVSIAGTPTVNVGTMPSVSISGTPSVMAHDAGQPQAVFGSCYASGTSGGGLGAACIAYTVPAGKRLVVEMISYQLASLGSTGAPFSVKAGLDAGQSYIYVGYPNVFAFPAGTPGVCCGGFSIYNETRDVRIYLDENQSLKIEADFDGGNIYGQNFAFSGFLVNK